MVRSVLADLFPNFMKRQASREQGSKSSGSLTALQSLQRKIRMADNTASTRPQGSKPQTPPARSEKHDPDRKDTVSDTKTPKPSGAPVRDVREDPAPNPNGEPKGNVTPRSTEKPVTGA